MRNLKRVLSLALALVMVLGMMVISTSAASFTDAEEIKYEEAVEVMSALGILKGYPDGSFKPEGTLTRAEAAKILAFVVLGAEADEYLTGSALAFDDIENNWAAKYITCGANLGIINGVGAGKFNPDGTLTIVQFAKMLLVAADIAGDYTGDGWENNVKKAVEKTEMAKTGIKITSAVITREEACELALAAMKSSAVASGYDVKVDGEVVKSFASLLDAKLYAADINSILGAGTATVEAAQAEGTLLWDTHKVAFNADAQDAFGRPGVGYVKTNAKNEKVIDLFYGEEAIVFEGYQDGTAGVYAINDALEAAGVKLTYDEKAQYPQNGAFKVDEDGKFLPIDVTVVEDGKASTKTLTTTYDVSKLTSGKDDVVMEIFVANKAISKIVVIETHAAIATDAVKADAAKEIKASVKLDGIVYETEELEEGDVVLFTKVWNAKKSAYAVAKIVDVVEPFTGKMTAYTSKNVFTVNGDTYTVSYGAIGDVKGAIKNFEMGEDYYYWLGANGEIIYAADNNLKEEVKEKTVYTYAVVLDAEGREYVSAEDAGLLSNGKDAVEAAELLKVKLADDTVVVLETAWKYIKDNKGEITGTKFVNGGAEPTVSSGLIKYAVNKDGKVTEIVPATAAAEAGKIDKAVADSVADVLTDSTVIYMESKGRYEVAIGYKNVAAATYTSAVVFADKGVVEAVVLNGYEPVEEVKEGTDHLVYVAGFDYVTEWDAAANNGEGAVVYTYTNLYIDGEKGSLTFEKKPWLEKGLFAYNTVTGLGETNLLAGTDDVALIQSGFFKAGDKIVYTNADTVYVEVTSKGLADAEGLPAVKDYTTTVQYVEYNKAGVATIVYFSAVEVEG